MSLTRLRALIVLGVLIAVAMSVVVWVILKDAEPSNSHDKATCNLTVATTIPEPEQVYVRVLNSTDINGLANKVGDELTARGFTVTERSNEQTVVDNVAMVRYGPRAAGSAQLIRAHFPDSIAAPNRSDNAEVDVILGPKFRELRAVEDVEGALRDLGEPELPTPLCKPAR